MPTYVYGCDTCGHGFEKVQSFHDAPLRECPECAAPVRRIFQPAGIVFKGSGWYSKDSRAGAKGEEGPAKTADQTPAEGKADVAAKPATDGKGEAAAKPAAKEPAKATLKAAE